MPLSPYFSNLFNVAEIKKKAFELKKYENEHGSKSHRHFEALKKTRVYKDLPTFERKSDKN